MTTLCRADYEPTTEREAMTNPDATPGNGPELQALCSLLESWCKRRGYQPASADELIESPALAANGSDYWWLRAYLRLWDLTQEALRRDPA